MTESTDKKMGFTHDNKKNITVDWWTPEWIFKAMDVEFDLDPASPKGGVPWLPAKKHYCEADNGLIQKWEGFVWLNPPYGKETGIWLERLHHHGNGVALVFSRTDCKWFHETAVEADKLLFMKGRISFVDGLNKTKSQGAGAGSLMLGYGPRGAEAISRMERYGWMTNGTPLLQRI